MLRLLPLALVVGVLFAGSTPPPAQPAEAPPDSLFMSVRAGTPLVTLLPADGDLTLRPLRAPALSWLNGRSFYWRTLPGEEGREFVLVERRRGETPLDTLVLVVDVVAD